MCVCVVEWQAHARLNDFLPTSEHPSSYFFSPFFKEVDIIEKQQKGIKK
jgi:hypothetical protein